MSLMISIGYWFFLSPVFGARYTERAATHQDYSPLVFMGGDDEGKLFVQAYLGALVIQHSDRVLKGCLVAICINGKKCSIIDPASPVPITS